MLSSLLIIAYNYHNHKVMSVSELNCKKLITNKKENKKIVFSSNFLRILRTFEVS